ncbi:DEAD-box ATP-dependent RNA helicase, partial [Haematococcus lacustris]
MVAARDSDFNAGFKFDVGGDQPLVQAAWEFSGALKQAKDELLKNKHKTTTIDEKIRSRVDAKKSAALRKAAAKSQAAQNGGSKGSQHHARGMPGNEDASDSEGGEDSEEDVALPGVSMQIPMHSCACMHQ